MIYQIQIILVGLVTLLLSMNTIAEINQFQVASLTSQADIMVDRPVKKLGANEMTRIDNNLNDTYTFDQSLYRDEIPTAGAPDYLFFGPQGLCAEHTDWSQLNSGDIIFDYDRHLISIKGTVGVENYIQIFIDDQDTITTYDDKIVVRMASYENGPDSVKEISGPYYDVDSNSGSAGFLATSNEPKALYFRKAEFSASTTIRQALSNRTRIPMMARAYFGNLVADVPSGFRGGDGPDCVRGSSNNDIIYGGDGADYLRGFYGDDVIYGGEGPDTINGGTDDDRLYGQGGVDHVIGEEGDDCLSGGQDGLQDVLEDSGSDFKYFIAEEGVLNGVLVDNIEYIIGSESPNLSDMCP